MYDSQLKQTDRKKVTDTMRRFGEETSSRPRAWKVRFIRSEQTVSCNIHVYFRDSKTLRIEGAGEDEHTALDNCLLKIGTVPRTQTLPDFPLLGNG